MKNFGEHSDNVYGSGLELTFEEFLRGPKELNVWERWHSTPQLMHITNENGKNVLDFMGHCETLQTDFDRVCNILKIRKVRLPYENTSDRLHYTEYYNDVTRKLVAERYACDIEALGYTFGD